MARRRDKQGPGGATEGGPEPKRRRFRLLRSAGVRFAVLYALVFGVSTVVLGASLRYSTLGLMNRETHDAIQADWQSLNNHFQQGGLPGLVLSIRNRIDEDISRNAIYLLVDPLGNRIVGNLVRWPPQVIDSPPGWYEVAVVAGNNKRSQALLREYELPGGFRLLIGRDQRTSAQLRRILRDGLIWALAAMVALGAVGAFVIRGLFRRSLAEISATTRAISRGDLTPRVRRSGSGDEFDQLAETINDMLDRISRLMDGVRQVSNAIAHDLRTPITRARARLEDAVLHARTEDELRAAIDRATADLDGVVRVFHALLRIAEIEAGSRRSAFADFDLVPMLVDLAEFYEALAEEQGLTFEHAWPDSVKMFGDRDMIQQAVANLIDNALKFAPAGTPLILAVRTDGAEIEIHVADRGPGIPESERARATERFYRVETARSTPGSGLGLSLVLAIAQLHGGSLRLEDNQPGLRAILVLPRRAQGQDGGGRIRLRAPRNREPAQIEQ